MQLPFRVPALRVPAPPLIELMRQIREGRLCFDTKLSLPEDPLASVWLGIDRGYCVTQMLTLKLCMPSACPGAVGQHLLTTPSPCVGSVVPPLPPEGQPGVRGSPKGVSPQGSGCAPHFSLCRQGSGTFSVVGIGGGRCYGPRCAGRREPEHQCHAEFVMCALEPLGTSLEQGPFLTRLQLECC